MIPALGAWEKVIWHLMPGVRTLFSSTLYHLGSLIFGKVPCWKRQPSGRGKKKGHHFEKAVRLHLSKSFKYMRALGPSDATPEIYLPKEIIQNTCSLWHSSGFFLFLIVAFFTMVKIGISLGVQHRGQR